MKAPDVAKVYVAISAMWPPNLVPPLAEENLPLIAGMLPPEMTLDHALSVVREFARRGSPFPPSWPEIAERWQAITSGIPDDPDLIANQWLAEVYEEVGRVGGTFYRAMPMFSDPIIGAAVVQAAGSWRQWGATTNGGPGEEGAAFTRNLIPERDKRFRQAVTAMLTHRARTGEALPAIVAGAARGELPEAVTMSDGEWVARQIGERASAVPDLSMERKVDGAE